MEASGSQARIKSYDIKLIPFSLYCPSTGKEGIKNFHNFAPDLNICPYCNKKIGKNKDTGECDLSVRRA